MRIRILLVCLLIATLAAFGSMSCAADGGGDSVNAASSASSGSGSGGSGGSDTGGNGGSGGSIFNDGGAGPFEDFPANPVVESGLPADIANQFENAMEVLSDGPCLAEPTIGAMVPRNWTPLFFEWTSPNTQTVYELKLEVENQVNPLTIYTTNVNYTVDALVWEGLTANSAGQDIEVSIRGAGFDGSSLTGPVHRGVSGAVHLAPVEAPGSVVYWTSSSNTAFMGFSIGDTSVKTILTPEVAGPANGPNGPGTGGGTICVGCHTSSPDGKLLFYSRHTTIRAIDVRNIDGTPVDESAVSSTALSLLSRNRQSAPLLSAAHFSPNDAVALTIWTPTPGDTYNNTWRLIWTDLHAQDATENVGWGTIDRKNDTGTVSSPTWSHDGTTIAYVSSAIAADGAIAREPMDIYTVPYNGRQGGTATPLNGASDPGFQEFYPVYSPNDSLLAFNRAEVVYLSSFDQPSAELFVMPAGGGTATRLSANDPPSCTGAVSPGLTNSWARWAPRSETVGNKNYYWLVFSSRRRAASNLEPQLYVSAVVTETNNGVESLVAEYPALYITSQDPQERNHTPAWDVFDVDPLPN